MLLAVGTVAFQRDVKSLTSVIDELGNLFQDESSDLSVLDTKNIMETSVNKTVEDMKVIGEEQFSKYVQERLVDCAVPITDPIFKNKLPLFSRPTAKLPWKKNL